MKAFRYIAAACACAALAAAFAGTASAGRYVVVFKNGHSGAGIAAVHRAGGTIVRNTRVGVATVSARSPAFARALRASNAVVGVARNASFLQAASPNRVTRAAASPSPSERATCQALYGSSAPSGPDELAPCQWDMERIHANPGSYAVNLGAGAVVGDMDTGIDLTHPEFAGNLDLARSCTFIYATTPTSDPSEQVTPGDCSNKASLQDLSGHGTHTAGTIAAQIDGRGISGVAPQATLVVLKAGTANGYFFTDSVVNALVYAGDQQLDAVNMSFFADPWLFNCRNDTEQKAIIEAIKRAAGYAQQRGVVLVAAEGNEGIDLNHPTVDEISPDFPPGAATARPVNNSCIVLPTELPGVVVVSATGAENLLAWYSSYGMTTDVAAPGGSRFQTPTFDPSRGRVLSPYSSTAGDLALEDALGRLVQDPVTNAYYAWLNGTSMAAPHVTGVAALIRAEHPDLAAGAVAAIIRQTATPLPCPAELDPGVEFFGAPVQVCKGGRGNTNFYGKGLVDALAAVSK
jgi:lantibiotic leader peptide-processing serine protease